MSFSCKIVLSDYGKDDQTRKVYLQAIIDRKRAIVPLGFYVKPESFDTRGQRMKAGHPNAKNFDTEFLIALAKANDIASRFRQAGKLLTPSEFKNEFINPADIVDFTKFIESELELKRPSIAHNTYKQHRTVVNKLREFKKFIPFNHISIELMQQFQNFLMKGNSGPTVHKLLRIVKQYVILARRKGMKFKDPFEVIKIKSFKSNRLSLTETEVIKMDEYYRSPDCEPSHKRLLQYFLFSCFTGVRISDISQLQWQNIQDNLLVFVPIKTRAQQQEVKVPLGEWNKKYLPPFTSWNEKIFKTFADPVSNRYIKKIADKLDIKKKITYHSSRHTFGSLFAEGGNIVALQRIMGHGTIKSTMGYVHTSTKNLVDATNARFGKGIPTKNEPSN
jgi:integrase/recombinase XerD